MKWRRQPYAGGDLSSIQVNGVIEMSPLGGQVATSREHVLAGHMRLFWVYFRAASKVAAQRS
jgi:hypothetical protein